MEQRSVGAAFVHAEWQRILKTPWAVRFGVGCTAAVVAIIALCWVVFGFGSLGLDATATFAAVLGITLAIGLGVGLMTLVFYSNRSGQDDAVRDKTVDHENPAPRVGVGDTRR
ncbi:MAG TPA: hypothetical protein VMH36_10310 [Alphaproteobacteria bacterium]|nr:hypothetical protein [Alphaproteobacteria bacterium]